MTNRSSIKQCFGGVARNIAEACSRAGVKPILVTALGDDQAGSLVRKYMEGLCLLRAVVIEGARTGHYLSVTVKGRQTYALGDHEINERLTLKHVDSQLKDYDLKGTLVGVDCNLRTEELALLLDYLGERGARVWVEGLRSKTQRLLDSKRLPAVHYLKLNSFENELVTSQIEVPSDVILITTKGSQGVFVRGDGQSWQVPALPAPAVQREVGAGDTLSGVAISCLHRQMGLRESLELGVAGAYQTIGSQPESGTVSADLGLEVLRGLRSKINDPIK